MTPMERRLPAVKVWLTADGDLCVPGGDLQAGTESTGVVTLELDSLAASLPSRRPTGSWLDPLVPPAPRRKSSSSCASARSSVCSSTSPASDSPGGSRRSSTLSQRSCSVCSRCSRGRLALVLSESRRSSRASRSSTSSAASRLLEMAARSPRRSSTLSRLSETLSLASARHAVLFTKGCGAGGLDEASWPTLATAGRLTFTQRLAFPTLAGSEVRHKRRSHFREAEAHMNLFAKLITVVILCLVFVLLVGVLYRFLR